MNYSFAKVQSFVEVFGIKKAYKFPLFLPKQKKSSLRQR